ncbi:MAG: hypothetical protein HYS44_03470 [Candidatus Niyogibacteria bacterium]|nr:hypothetical protein [Candidatus Niyogibacteria bacterium]
MKFSALICGFFLLFGIATAAHGYTGIERDFKLGVNLDLAASDGLDVKAPILIIARFFSLGISLFDDERNGYLDEKFDFVEYGAELPLRMDPVAFDLFVGRLEGRAYNDDGGKCYAQGYKTGASLGYAFSGDGDNLGGGLGLVYTRRFIDPGCGMDSTEIDTMGLRFFYLIPTD